MQITEYLTNNKDVVLDILDKLEFDKLSYDASKKQIRFSRETGRNPTSVVFSLDTLSFYCFSSNEKGNLYTLVMERKELNFPKALEWIADITGIKKSEFQRKIRLPFGGFYKGLIKEIQEPEYSMNTYDSIILDEYSHKYNLPFLKDGISFETQEEYNIGFDLESLRITIPIWTLDGKLCGIMGRSLDSECPKENRWLPIIPCSRSLTISAYHRNYQSIQQKGIVVIGESDKFPMQLSSFGIRVGLATSGCIISETQTKYLKALLVPKIIIAYDEGLDEEFIRNEASKLKINNYIFNNHVGYIYDKNNMLLPKGSKMSPTDCGVGVFKELITKYVNWI